MSQVRQYEYHNSHWTGQGGRLSSHLKITVVSTHFFPLQTWSRTITLYPLNNYAATDVLHISTVMILMSILLVLNRTNLHPKKSNLLTETTMKWNCFSMTHKLHCLMSPNKNGQFNLVIKWAIIVFEYKSLHNQDIALSVYRVSFSSAAEPSLL